MRGVSRVNPNAPTARIPPAPGNTRPPDHHNTPATTTAASREGSRQASSQPTSGCSAAEIQPANGGLVAIRPEGVCWNHHSPAVTISSETNACLAWS